MKSIGIFPAAGGLGGSTYRHLLKLVPNDKVTLICRFPEKIEKEYVDAGVTVRKATYEYSPQKLETVFDGLDVLFLISYPTHVREFRTKIQMQAIDAARRAGVKHIVYSSLAFASDPLSGMLKDSSETVVMQSHLDSEEYLASQANADPTFTYTSVREGLYSESTSLYTAQLDPKTAPDGAEVLIPHDGKGPGVSWVKRDELGEATAKLIARYCGVGEPFPQNLVNGKVLLTGIREITLEETLEILGKAVGKTFKIRQVPVDEYAKQPQVLEIYLFKGDEEKAAMWAKSLDGIRAGEAALVTKDLEDILGRKPESFENTVKDLFA